MGRYASWGVAEYFLYDPRRAYVAPPLRAFELLRGVYREKRPVALSNGERGIPSSTLGLELWLDGSVLRFYDRTIQRNLLTPKEERLQAQNARSVAEAARSEAEAANARAAEETAKRKHLEAELARLRRSTS